MRGSRRPSKRATLAGDVDDAPPSVASHEWKGLLTRSPGAEQVRFERLVGDPQVGVDSTLPRVVVDRRVVDQDVQPPVGLVDGPEATVDAVFVADVELKELRAQVGRRTSSSILVPGGEDRAEAVIEQLANDLATDASIGSGNQCHPSVTHRSLVRRHQVSLASLVARVVGEYVEQPLRPAHRGGDENGRQPDGLRRE